MIIFARIPWPVIYENDDIIKIVGVVRMEMVNQFFTVTDDIFQWNELIFVCIGRNADFKFPFFLSSMSGSTEYRSGRILN